MKRCILLTLPILMLFFTPLHSSFDNPENELKKLREEHHKQEQFRSYAQLSIEEKLHKEIQDLKLQLCREQSRSANLRRENKSLESESDFFKKELHKTIVSQETNQISREKYETLEKEYEELKEKCEKEKNNPSYFDLLLKTILHIH